MSRNLPCLFISLQMRQDGLERINLTANILWQLWKRRNKWQFSQEHLEGRIAIQMATQEWLEFETISKNKQGQSQSRSRSPMGSDREQLLQDPGSIIIHVGVTNNKLTNRGGSDILVKKSDGKIITVWAEAEHPAGDKETQEAKTIRKALIRAREEGWCRVIILTQSKYIASKARVQDSQDVRLAMIMDDIDRLSSLFCQCSFFVTKESGNKLCNRIAQFTENLAVEIEWKHVFPLWITHNQQCNLDSCPSCIYSFVMEYIYCCRLETKKMFNKILWMTQYATIYLANSICAALKTYWQHQYFPSFQSEIELKL